MIKENGVVHKVHYPWLDSIRFLAAFMVVLCHVRCEMLQTYSLLQPDSQNIWTQIFYFLSSGGKVGVLVFFILSGFLVGGKNLERVIKGKADAKTYVIDRSVRIGLPLIGSIILIWLVDILINHIDISSCNMSVGLTSTHNLSEFVGNLFGLQGVVTGDAGGVFWTLAYEIWFYVLIAGVIVLTTTRFSVCRRLFGFVLLGLGLLIFSYLELSWLSILLCGIGAFYLSKIGIGNRVLYISGLLFIVVLLIMPFTSATHTSRLVLNIPEIVIEMIAGVLGAITIAGLVNMTPKKSFTIKLNRLGSHLAIFSYSLYLTHYQVIRVMRAIGIPQYDTISAYTIIAFVCEVAACVLFAYCFYLLTEKQTDKVKRFLKSHV